MKVAIIGSRTAEIDKTFMLPYLPLGCSEIVSGGAKGVDSLAKEIADELDLAYTVFYPDYQRYGKKAPLKRNTQIIEYADYILAFWDYESAGTRNAILQALKIHKRIKIICI